MRLALIALLAVAGCSGGTSTPTAAPAANKHSGTAPAPVASSGAHLPLAAIGNLVSGVNKVTEQQLPQGLPLPADGALWLHGMAAGFNPQSACEPLLVLANSTGAALPEMVVEYTVRDSAGTAFTPDAGSLVKPLAAGAAHNVLGKQMAAGCEAVSITVQRVSCRDDQAITQPCPFTTLRSANHGLAAAPVLPPQP